MWKFFDRTSTQISANQAFALIRGNFT